MQARFRPFRVSWPPVGANPYFRRITKLLLNLISQRLSSLTNYFVSLGESVVLNSLMNSIPIIFPFLYEDESKGLEINFPLSKAIFVAMIEGDKIFWVWWLDVNKTKARGGFGIWDIPQSNLVLLGKWWWRLLDEGNGIWK